MVGKTPRRVQLQPRVPVLSCAIASLFACIPTAEAPETVRQRFLSDDYLRRLRPAGTLLFNTAYTEALDNSVGGALEPPPQHRQLRDVRRRSRPHPVGTTVFKRGRGTAAPSVARPRGGPPLLSSTVQTSAARRRTR